MIRWSSKWNRMIPFFHRIEIVPNTGNGRCIRQAYSKSTEDEARKKKKKMGNNCKVHEKLKNKKKCAFKYMNKKNK